ncbi:hypothetical protein E0Z10_g2006 [Xylaria hypoxylon]|uniref:Uncharacterized protein n=1 Tax=Xylaria hypoxylon TaxID=37992 RepID=A0A4Z0Z5C3_9PEZI|nr:hypothetical protein E0Z10_g2006 [Xylaria hypoxylon]
MADKPEESDDEHGGPAPHTPPQRRARPEPHHPHRRNDSDASTSHLSPPASPSMSLYSLGMSPLSPLPRQFSPHAQAPSSPLYPQSDSDHLGPDHGDYEDVTQDSKDVLVQRLNDLVAMLSQQHHVKGESINALHAKVDELENVLYIRDYSSKSKTWSPRLPSLNPGHGDQDGSYLSWKPSHPDNPLLSDVSSPAPPARPSLSAETRVDRRADKKAKSHASKMTVAEAEKIMAEAQDLHKNLEVHIHALLITRLERAAQRLIFLEEKIKDLETERKESDTELLSLQIQLKAIEVQCMSYVPQGADQELSESISMWKREYSTLKQKRARNKELFNSANSTPTGRRAVPPPERSIF